MTASSPSTPPAARSTGVTPEPVVGRTPSGGPASSPIDHAPATGAPPRPSVSASSQVNTLVGAGDIAQCPATEHEATAALLDDIPGLVFTTGDNAYGGATLEDFETCYGPSWGRHLDRTLPAPGNHEYEDNMAGYFAYFGDRAGKPGKSWYSVDLGSWHIVVLDSNCRKVGGCYRTADQEEWLAADLAASDAPCTLAIWHHPRFSTGDYGNDERFAPFWKRLYDEGAEIVVNGHEHDYERFVPQDASGARDDGRGIRQFVVGTGGADLRPFRTTDPDSEVRDAETHGVLRLTLRPDTYDWRFVPVAGAPFTDAGSGTCH